MKVSFRKLVNSAMVNNGENWVGFIGDSEYKDENDELVFGFWRFLEIKDEIDGEEYFNLDDEIDVIEELSKRNDCFNVKNDKGKICVIGLLYDV